MRLSKRTKRGLRIGVPLILIAVVLVWGSIPEGPIVVTPPPADAEPGRWVHVEGVANTRDAGGYPTRDGGFVKRGMIYRSAKLSRLSADGAETYRDLGVETVIDFCNRLTPWPLFGGDAWSVQLASSVRGCPISFSKDGPDEEFYTRGVRDNAASYRKAFEILADGENYPVLYHCAAGTDRTGVMSAMLLSLLGVDRETLMADFELSAKVDLAGYPDAMIALLDQIDAAGGVGPFLDELGVPRATQNRIRDNLIE